MSKPIRVLELRSVRGTGGGPEKTIMLSAAAADPASFHVTVCYIRDQRDDVFTLDDRARQMNIDYVEVPERHSFDPAIWPALRSLVRARRIDIVHGHEHKTDLLAWLLGKAEGVRPLATAHGWVGQSWKERLYYQGDKRLLARFPTVVAVSGEIRRVLIAHGAHPDRVITVLNSIDPNTHRRDPRRVDDMRAALGISRDDIAIGAVGRLERQKRFDLLLRAFKALRVRHPRLKLLIAGDGSLRRTLDTQIVELGLSESCRLLGNRSDVIGFHHALDLFVQSSEYEGTPNAVLEAMALESPIVATDAGGTAEIVHHEQHGLIVPCRDIGALSDAMERALFNEPEATRQRTAAARLRVEGELSFDARRRAVENVYRRIMSEPIERARTS